MWCNNELRASRAESMLRNSLEVGRLRSIGVGLTVMAGAYGYRPDLASRRLRAVGRRDG